METFEFHIVNIFECLRYQMFVNVAIMFILIERTEGRKKKNSDVIESIGYNESIEKTICYLYVHVIKIVIN